MKFHNLLADQRGAAMLIVLAIAAICLALMGATYIAVATVTSANLAENQKVLLRQSAIATVENLEMLVNNSAVDLSDATFLVGQFKGIDNINYLSFTAVPQTPSLMGGFLQRAAIEKIGAEVFHFHVVVSNPTINKSVRYDGLLEQIVLFTLYKFEATKYQ